MGWLDSDLMSEELELLGYKSPAKEQFIEDIMTEEGNLIPTTSFFFHVLRDMAHKQRTLELELEGLKEELARK